MAELRQVVVAYPYYQDVTGVWIPVTPTTPLPVTLTEIAVDSGIATGGSNITLEDTTKDWEVNMWIGSVVEIDIGGIEYHRTITANTATILTFNALPGIIVVGAGDPYQIRRVAAPAGGIIREIQHNVVGYVTPADIIAAALAPIYAPSSFRVEAAFSAGGGILTTTITRGANTQTVSLNAGVGLNVNAIFRFDIIVCAGDTINYRYSLNTNILVFRVIEVPGAVS
jgi:hypothetical protein